MYSKKRKSIRVDSDVLQRVQDTVPFGSTGEFYDRAVEAVLDQKVYRVEWDGGSVEVRYNGLVDMDRIVKIIKNEE